MKNSFCALVLLCLSQMAFAQTKNFIDQPYIEVAGYADTLVVPNEIYIMITVTDSPKNMKGPVEEQESKIVSSLKSLGINTEKDLTTSDMLSNYRYYLFGQKDIIKSKEYILKVTTAELASKVFIALEDLRISNTSIFRVDHSDLESIQNTCRTLAIVNAQQKAIALTKPLAQNIGNAIHINEVDSKFDADLHGRTPRITQHLAGSYDEKMKFGQAKIEFEKIKVSSTIQVKFVLK